MTCHTPRGARHCCSNKCASFVSVFCSGYKLHHFETATGYKFVLLTDPSVENIMDTLEQVANAPVMGGEEWLEMILCVCVCVSVCLSV